MRKLVIFICFFSLISFSQNIVEIDSMSYVMCDYLKTLDIDNDTLKLKTLYDKKLKPFLLSKPKNELESTNFRLYYRLQRNCVEFRNLLDKISPPKEASTRIDMKPISIINSKDLTLFKTQYNFTYFEVDGTVTKVLMKEGYWTDTFVDNTYSKLSYKWINDFEFELNFIESNNETRLFTSIEGDKYLYQVLSKEDGYFLLTLNIPGQKTYEKFKLYFN